MKSLLKPLTKKAIRTMMDEVTGNRKHWPCISPDKNQIPGSQRGILVRFPTQHALSDLLIIRAMMKAAAGSEKNIVWNGLPSKPFTYDVMVDYVSVMFCICDEKGIPTPEYLMYLRLTEILKHQYCLNDDDNEYREGLRCRIVIVEGLMELIQQKVAWHTPTDAAEILLAHWKREANVDGGDAVLSDLTWLPTDLIERVAQDYGWQKISASAPASLRWQKDRLMAKWKSLRNRIVRLTFGKPLQMFRRALLADIRKLRATFVRKASSFTSDKTSVRSRGRLTIPT